MRNADFEKTNRCYFHMNGCAPVYVSTKRRKDVFSDILCTRVDWKVHTLKLTIICKWPQK